MRNAFSFCSLHRKYNACAYDTKWYRFNAFFPFAFYFCVYNRHFLYYTCVRTDRKCAGGQRVPTSKCIYVFVYIYIDTHIFHHLQNTHVKRSIFWNISFRFVFVFCISFPLCVLFFVKLLSFFLLLLCFRMSIFVFFSILVFLFCFAYFFFLIFTCVSLVLYIYAFCQFQRHVTIAQIFVLRISNKIFFRIFTSKRTVDNGSIFCFSASRKYFSNGTKQQQKLSKAKTK